ncbi:Transposon Tn1000 resolvase [uncultured Clostridium sp.]|uniref:recombinase family protein n=1 Tax=uncultured Clostridium sp. TaxID=59620 RepID=UPI00082279E5|nr:recombinase family protein [uncultured Clostridium sp.]SCI99733.1 Transposon Tn1000 resolvase [uncultured Clostridium sp.]
MIYGYARCSTNETKQDITRQTRELQNLGVSKDNIFFEYESGSKTDRVELNKLLSKIEPGDTIIATEVSRITRSNKQLIEIIEIARDKKLKLILGTFTLDCTGEELDPMAKAMLSMMGVFAELEKDMISQRVKSGMANAKAKGKIIGRPELTKDDIPSIFYKHYPLYKSKKIKVAEFARLCNMSRTTIYKYLKMVES